MLRLMQCYLFSIAYCNVVRGGSKSLYDYNVIYSECIKLYPYMKDTVEYIKEIQPPAKGERIKLHRKMQTGDKIAKKRLIESYLPITLRLSTKAAVKNEMPLRDLFSDSVIAVCDKLVKYNEDEFSVLTSYVLRGVNHVIQKHIRNCIYRTDCHNCTDFLPHLAADCPRALRGKI